MSHNNRIRADPKDAIVRRHVTNVTFGLYTDTDVRNRSVLEITSPEAYLNDTPLPNGLYDPRLGPLNAHELLPCPTCAGRFLTCPGHFGHLEVCVPLYQPLLWGDLLTVLRSLCFHCHKLRHFKRKLLEAHAKLLLLQHQQIQQFYDLDSKLASAVQGGGKPSEKEQAVETVCRDIVQEYQGRPLPRQVTQVAASLLRNYRASLLREWKAVPQCRHCLAFNPKLKQDQSNKIFQLALSDKQARINAAGNITMKPAVETLLELKQKKVTGSGSGYESDDTVLSDAEDNEEEMMADDDDEETTGTGRNRFIDDEAIEVNNEDSEEEQSDVEEEDEELALSHKKKQRSVKKAAKLAQSEELEDSSKAATKSQFFMSPTEVQAQCQLLWKHYGDLLTCLLFQGNRHGLPSPQDTYQLFFCQAIAVPPSRFRPPMNMGTMLVEHAQNGYLQTMLRENALVRQELFLNNHSEAKAHEHWINLQTNLNCLMDSTKNPAGNNALGAVGIRQILEKKEGIFRKHMMGKRVDSACRSVISPDPYIGTNEIGIPLAFAKVLTYPTPVTEWNMTELRRLVERGPNQYPGARWVEIHKNGPNDGRTVRIDLVKMDPEKRRAVGAMLLKDSKAGGVLNARPVVVGRQLRHGDVMLVNRQPTLHKPGIMAHQVRILHDPNQKTIRMHYANCNTYNADFDGDEMNCHFPQSDVARAEATYIAQTDLQYIVPTDGSPLRGLIQDHVVGGVKLTTKDTFLKRWEYQQLLFATLSSLPRLEVIEAHQDIELVPPAILKPEPLWTGKQVITTLLLHLCNSPRGKKQQSATDSNNLTDTATETKMLRQGGISLERKSTTPGTAFGMSQEEHLVLIRDGELLRGILDKSAFGAKEFSLVHGVYEAYGPTKAGLLLNSLGRLFTAYIQYFAGHSCRVEDLVLTPATDKTRRDLVQRAYNIGSRACKAWADSDGGKVPIEPVSDKEGANELLKPVEVASASAKIGQLLGGAQGKENFAALDGYMMSQLNPLASEIVKECLPNGLAVPFPANTFGLMTTTGAKGSIVNQSQVSCALGQQALEGRRVPRLNSGRTLPSFAPYDLNPRADGFVMDRFLTGVRPQEYYFHCMAGREGLVDTAVKTSRSGYLQRCLIKHLEELKVCYDYTVRNGEGGVVQFLYGEDALDPTKASFLDCTTQSFEFMARNHRSMKLLNTPLPGCSIDVAASDHARSEALGKKGDAQALMREGDHVLARRLRAGSSWTRGALLKGWFDAIVTKTHKSGTSLDLQYTKDGHEVRRVPLTVNLGRCGGASEEATSSVCALVKPAVTEPILSAAAGAVLRTRGDGKSYTLGSTGACVSERVAGAAKEALSTKKLELAMEASSVSGKSVGRLVAAKFANALCAPGEAVGCIAAQSVGEPSTQMTLNTFHLAGAGANVTLGIPRLREIIMTASRTLKTPTMSVPLTDSVTESEALRLSRSFSKLTLMDLLAGHQGVAVRETLRVGFDGSWQRAYFVTLRLHPEERIQTAFGLSLKAIGKSIGKSFLGQVNKLMTMELKRSKTESDIGTPMTVGGGKSTSDIQEVDDKANDSNNENAGGTGNNDDGISDDGNESGDDEADYDFDKDAPISRYNRSEDATALYGDAAEDDNAMPDQDMEDDGDEEMMQDPVAGTKLHEEGGIKIDKTRNSITLPPFTVDPSARPLLMVGLVEKAAEKHLVLSRKNIDQAFVNKEEGRGRCLQTAGVNFEEFWMLDSSIVDNNRLMSNDTWAIRDTFGVEAARSNIVEQIRSVFGAYGIEVDPRHLTLIADYMTYEGGYKAMNRIGMEEMSSTFLQMSFETTAHFLTQAACGGKVDELESPSANIVLGRPIKHGTGAFDVLVKTSV